MCTHRKKTKISTKKKQSGCSNGPVQSITPRQPPPVPPFYGEQLDDDEAVYVYDGPSSTSYPQQTSMPNTEKPQPTRRPLPALPVSTSQTDTIEDTYMR